MTTIELITAIGGGPVITAAGVGAWKLFKMWLDARREDAQRDDAREDRMIDRLATRVETLEKRNDDCAEALASARAAKELAEKTSAECAEDREELRAMVMRSREDITERIDLAAERIVARSTPPSKLPPPRR